MSAKAIREATGQTILSKHLKSSSVVKTDFAVVTEDTCWDTLAQQHPWLCTEVFYCFIRLLSQIGPIAVLPPGGVGGPDPPPPQSPLRTN